MRKSSLVRINPISHPNICRFAEKLKNPPPSYCKQVFFLLLWSLMMHKQAGHEQSNTWKIKLIDVRNQLKKYHSHTEIKELCEKWKWKWVNSVKLNIFSLWIMGKEKFLNPHFSNFLNIETFKIILRLIYCNCQH